VFNNTSKASCSFTKTVENLDPDNDENVVGSVEQSEGQSPAQAMSLKCEE
jgi:hypothetical protein